MDQVSAMQGMHDNEGENELTRLKNEEEEG